MRATVVIPTFNRATHLRRALRALEGQDTSAFDVIVTDDGSRDDTPSVLRERFRFELTALSQPNAGPGAARNTAVRHAAGDVIIFVDDDVVPAPDLVRRHLEAQQRAPGVVIGRMAMPEGRTQPVWAEWEGRGLQRQYDMMVAAVFAPTPRQFYTANASVPRDALLRAGLFDESFRRAEDVELAYRLGDLGLPFRFLADAAVVHDTPRPLDAWRRMALEYGRYDIIMWRDKGRAHILRNIAEERRFARALPVRALTRLAGGRPWLVTPLTAAGSGLIRTLPAAGLRTAARSLCSAMFNMLYLHAASEEYGSRRAFWRAVDREAADASAEMDAAAEPA